ncbi:uncharacterized protein LOC124888809 [Capsicum annuum]|uniref:uncharacterized protein LOC124888809 n=1 Tax=Capsicum annuum TaxID=4072 RepID=UPI001FB05D37|nr:uncharacterized protein LOC124888809 [Capsicum annuum]
MQSGNLDYAPGDVVISYLMNSRENVNPTIINSDVRVLMYMIDVDADGIRPILRIHVDERSVEGLVNSSERPPPRRVVDNDFSNYENDDNQPINTEDDPMHMKEVSSNSQDDEEDRGTGSQPRHCFNNGANFHLDQIFAYKKELKILLNAAAYVGLNTCGVEHATQRHKRLSSKLISSLCVNYFRDGKGPSINEIQRIVFKELQCHARYWMCWKGSAITKNIIRGTPEHGYACLPAFSYMVELLNPRFSYSIMVNQINGAFVYYFLAFGACIRGYAHMKKVITIDGTHLYGKYRGLLLSAVAQDTENHIFPIAFYVVDKENDTYWTFIFQKLKSIIEDELDLCVISDRHISIANAFFRFIVVLTMDFA